MGDKLRGSVWVLLARNCGAMQGCFTLLSLPLCSTNIRPQLIWRNVMTLLLSAMPPCYCSAACDHVAALYYMHLVAPFCWRTRLTRLGRQAALTSLGCACLSHGLMHAAPRHIAVGFACSEADAEILDLTPDQFCIEGQDVPWQLSTLTL